MSRSAVTWPCQSRALTRRAGTRLRRFCRVGSLELRPPRRINVLARHPPAVVGGEKCRDVGDIIRLADPAESGEGAGELPDLRIAEKSCAQVGLDNTWCEGVHGNAPRAELLREFERQDVEGSLAHRVGSQRGPRNPSGRGRDVDDATAIPQARQGS